MLQIEGSQIYIAVISRHWRGRLRIPPSPPLNNLVGKIFFFFGSLMVLGEGFDGGNYAVDPTTINIDSNGDTPQQLSLSNLLLFKCLPVIDRGNLWGKICVRHSNQVHWSQLENRAVDLVTGSSYPACEQKHPLWKVIHPMLIIFGVIPILVYGSEVIHDAILVKINITYQGIVYDLDVD